MYTKKTVRLKTNRREVYQCRLARPSHASQRRVLPFSTTPSRTDAVYVKLCYVTSVSIDFSLAHLYLNNRNIENTPFETGFHHQVGDAAIFCVGLLVFCVGCNYTATANYYTGKR